MAVRATVWPWCMHHVRYRTHGMARGAPRRCCSSHTPLPCRTRPRNAARPHRSRACAPVVPSRAPSKMEAPPHPRRSHHRPAPPDENRRETPRSKRRIVGREMIRSCRHFTRARNRQGSPGMVQHARPGALIARIRNNSSAHACVLNPNNRSNQQAGKIFQSNILR